MLGIVPVRTLRRFGIELQRRMVEFAISDFAGVITRHRILAYQPEESAPFLVTREKNITVLPGWKR